MQFNTGLWLCHLSWEAVMCIVCGMTVVFLSCWYIIQTCQHQKNFSNCRCYSFYSGCAALITAWNWKEKILYYVCIGHMPEIGISILAIWGRCVTSFSFAGISVENCMCWLCGLFTEAVARIQEIIDGKNLRKDFRASSMASSQPSSIGWTAPVSSVGGISSSVSFILRISCMTVLL